MKDTLYETREYPASVDALGQAMAFAEEAMEAAGVPPRTAMQVSIALEEMFVNIAHYAYPEEGGKLWLGIATADRCVSLRLTDRGQPFDPLAKTDPDVTLSAEDRPIGGLGVYMVKKTMDELSYQYADGENRLTMKKNY